MNRFGERVNDNASGKDFAVTGVFIEVMFGKNLMNRMPFIEFEFENVGSVLM
ncbi:MAG: hypothetical protein RMJ36_05420 [Candidatus Calescibacterium sp.]|nr:hypothetical protein [Candidatus Calescibacterium sp.]MDW8133075.1 hypothetical protein [Candidatus Calescibacterium sp.]